MKIKKLRTLNESADELVKGVYSVIDHNLADAMKKEQEGKEKAAEVIEDRIKDFSIEDRDAHTKVDSTPVLKKMMLAESLFEEWGEEDSEIDESTIYDDEEDTSWVEDLIDALKTYDAGDYEKDPFFKELKELYFKHFPYPEEIIDESIDGNTSHAQDFVSALRSAGFGDGFDQKLKIDTYGNGGTRVEYKDQGGTFIVTITDDKVTLEGQDEGDAPFKKEFSTWEEFASEFESLYPGIPVRENKILVEASYTRSDDKIMLVKQTREPLIDIIQMELTDGEWGYVKSPDGTITPSRLPHLGYDSSKAVGVSFDNSGRWFIRVWDTNKEDLQKVADVAKKYDREYKIDYDKNAIGSKKWYCLIYLNEATDFDDPYVDPNAEVNYEGIKGRGTKMRGNPEGRHIRDNEDLEDSQRYPIESPAPAQTGLAMMEDISVNGSLMEDRIATNMIHDFKPAPGIAEETFNRVLEAGKMETFEFALEERFPHGVTTEELNKLLSDEAQWVYNQLGMKEFITPDEDDNQ